MSEALREIKERGRGISIDGIYSILGLLPYGEEVNVDYQATPQAALYEVMKGAVGSGYGEPFAWHGLGSEVPGLC